MAADIVKIIQQARQAGVPDQQTLSTLQQKGLIDAQGNAVDQPAPTQSNGQIVPTAIQANTSNPSVLEPLKTVANLPGSAVNTALGIAGANLPGQIAKIPGAISGYQQDYAAAQQSQASDQQARQHLLDTIQSNQALGKDTTRLQNFYNRTYGNVDPSKELGNFTNNILSDVPKAAYQSIVPEAAQKLIAGDTEGAQKSIEEDPVGNILPFLLVAREAAYKTGGGEAFDNIMQKAASPIEKPLNSFGNTIADWGTRLKENFDNPQVAIPKTISDKFSPGKLASAQDYMGTLRGDYMEKYTASRDIQQSFEDGLQSNLNGTLSNVSAPKPYLTSGLDDIVKEYTNKTAQYNDVVRTIDKIKSTIDDTQGENIPLGNLLEAKRSFDNASHAAIGDAVTKELNGKIADVYRKLIEDSLDQQAHFQNTNLQIPPELQKYFGGKSEVNIHDYNQKYGDVNNGTKILSRLRNKTPQHKLVSLGKKIAGDVTGGIVGHIVAGPIGAIGGGYIGDQIQKGITNESLASGVSKVTSIPNKVIKAANPNIPRILP